MAVQICLTMRNAIHPFRISSMNDECISEQKEREEEEEKNASHFTQL